MQKNKVKSKYIFKISRIQMSFVSTKIFAFILGHAEYKLHIKCQPINSVLHKEGIHDFY